VLSIFFKKIIEPILGGFLMFMMKKFKKIIELILIGIFDH
jgi:hypothetical protein